MAVGNSNGTEDPGSSLGEISKPVQITFGDVVLTGDLCIPSSATGLVIFAHGSGSSRHSSRNKYVAAVLNDYECATLLIDLLSPEEELADRDTGKYRFDIPMLASRLVKVSDSLMQQTWASHLKLGYFGSSTGGGAALMAAAKKPLNIAAVVSRGGRPDLAEKFLYKVKAPTLLIVGEYDHQVIVLNENAGEEMSAHWELDIVQGASHLFVEPGTLEIVAHKAARWFIKYFSETTE